MMTQALMLAKQPHIIIATPGRLVDHLENTKGFNLRSLKFLVMDEADRILNMDFEQEVDKILKVQISDVIVLDSWFIQYFISLYTHKYLTINTINGPGSDSKLKADTSHFLKLDI